MEAQYVNVLWMEGCRSYYSIDIFKFYNIHSIYNIEFVYIRYYGYKVSCSSLQWTRLD